jgi:hypothetical protein
MATACDMRETPDRSLALTESPLFGEWDVFLVAVWFTGRAPNEAQAFPRLELLADWLKASHEFFHVQEQPPNWSPCLHGDCRVVGLASLSSSNFIEKMMC